MRATGVAIALLAGAALGLQTACAANQTSAGQVLLTDSPDTVKGCHFLGQVKGSDPTWGTTAQGLSESQSEIKNQASQLGADTVFVTSAVGAGGTYGGTSVQGDAYNCRRAAAASPGAKPKANADKPQ
jgi:uncharacterized protein DUF4156